MNDRGFKFHKSVQGSKRLIWKVKSGFQSQSYPLLLRDHLDTRLLSRKVEIVGLILIHIDDSSSVFKAKEKDISAVPVVS